MNKRFSILTILTFLIFCNCGNKYQEQVVAVELIETSGIYFSYNYLDSNFKGKFDLGYIVEDFSSSDSLKIKINKDAPEEFEFISVIERVWEKEDAIVSLVNRDSDQVIFNYHSIDQKPLFVGANDEYDNDYLISDYLISKINLSNDYKKIGVYILINETGQVSLDEVMTNNEVEVEYVKQMIDRFPAFSPPIHEGDSVTVSYLIEIPMNKMKK